MVDGEIPTALRRDTATERAVIRRCSLRPQRPQGVRACAAFSAARRGARASWRRTGSRPGASALVSSLHRTRAVETAHDLAEPVGRVDVSGKSTAFAAGELQTAHGDHPPGAMNGNHGFRDDGWAQQDRPGAIVQRPAAELPGIAPRDRRVLLIAHVEDAPHGHLPEVLRRFVEDVGVDPEPEGEGHERFAIGDVRRQRLPLNQIARGAPVIAAIAVEAVEDVEHGREGAVVGPDVLLVAAQHHLFRRPTARSSRRVPTA